MRIDGAPLLERLRLFHSRDPEETRAFLNGKDYRFEIPRREAGQLDARINGVYMPGVYVGYAQYGGASVALSPGRERPDTWIQLPLRGRLEARVGRDTIDCGPDRAVIASPVRETCRLVSEAGSTRIQLALTRSALLGQLAALLGEPPDAPLDFAPALDLTGGYGRSLARHVLMAVADLEDGGSILASPVTMSAFEQFIISALLLSHPHTYSEALRRLERPLAPRGVKRAIDYMEAHLQSPLTISEIVAAAGVAGRTLFQHFRDYRGMTPMQYLRTARFRRAREALMQADGDASVTEIALSWGFGHLGRFALEYQRRFGESPSATLKRRRARR